MTRADKSSEFIFQYVVKEKEEAFIEKLERD